MKPLESFKDPDFGTCNILYRNLNVLQDNVCLFASHTILPSLPDYVFYYLSDIKNAGFSIIFISSSEISSNDVSRLSLVSDVVISKDNRGTDFGAWCAVLRWLHLGVNYKHLYLCNDSVFGPFTPFAKIHQEFADRPEDLLGITDSYQGVNYHIQSYFVGVKQHVLKSDIWKRFWTKMQFLEDKSKVIEHYEIGLTKELMAFGFQWFVWANWYKQFDFMQLLHKISQSETLRERWLNRLLQEKENILLDVNPSSFLWLELITQFKNPFIKRELFLFEHLYEECEMEGTWEAVLKKFTSYPDSLIKRFLIQIFFYKAWKKMGVNDWLIIEQFPALNIVYPAKPDIDNYHIFSALATLFPSTADGQKIKPFEKALQLLNTLQIACLPVALSAKNKVRSTVCILVLLNERIVQATASQLSMLKESFRNVQQFIFIAENEGSAAIAASIFGIREDKIIIGEKLFIPNNATQLINELVFFYHGFKEGNLSLHHYRRPTVADIIAEVMDNSAYTNFIDPPLSSDFEIAEVFNAIPNMGEGDYGNFIAIRDKYIYLYEQTPTWYKKVGQIIKVLRGNKRVVLALKDKGKKEIYKSTAEDVAHWYYLQYEILPDWYKKIGKQLIKPK